MLPRRRSKKTTPNPISPPLTSSPVTDRRSLSPVAHQQPFRVPIAQTVGTVAFASESSPQENPPVPLRPVSSPPSPPGNSGPKRQQTRYGIQETLWPPPSEERVLQNVLSMPMPSISQAPEPPGGVGGFPSIPKFATYSDSSSPPCETTDMSGGVHAEVWATYNKVSEEFDEKRLKKWNEDLDVLLIFVSLLVNKYDHWF